MSRYIKVEDMRAIFCQSNSLTQAWNGFDMLPSIDIVRCKECKEHKVISFEENAYFYWCELRTHAVNADDFCSFGDRREL